MDAVNAWLGVLEERANESVAMWSAYQVRDQSPHFRPLPRLSGIPENRSRSSTPVPASLPCIPCSLTGCGNAGPARQAVHAAHGQQKIAGPKAAIPGPTAKLSVTAPTIDASDSDSSSDDDMPLTRDQLKTKAKPLQKLPGLAIFLVPAILSPLTPPISCRLHTRPALRMRSSSVLRRKKTSR